MSKSELYQTLGLTTNFVKNFSNNGLIRGPILRPVAEKGLSTRVDYFFTLKSHNRSWTSLRVPPLELCPSKVTTFRSLGETKTVADDEGNHLDYRTMSP